jgi:SNF2 family DNA or RNA helicase
MPPCVYATNYEKVVSSPLQCAKKWNRIILDEAHKIRNGKSDTAFYIRRLEAPIRWAVTGTPLVNSFKDIVSLLAFIGVPCPYNFAWDPYFLTILPELLIHRSMELIRSKIAGAPPLPEIIHEILPFTTPAEEEFYAGVQCTDNLISAQYARDVLTNAQTFLLLLRLRQLAAHPQLYINAKRREDSTYDREDWLGACTKFDRVIDIIQEDDAEVHKYIIFCQFNEEMEFLEAYLNDVVPEVLCYNGSMNQADRTAVLKRSKETQHNTVLLIQLQAGGVGLNLQEYDRIIFMSPWWTSALMDQAIARAVRMGQTKVVKVYHLQLICETPNPGIINIDERITKKADEKRIMLQKIFAECQQAQIKPLPKRELEPGEVE